MISRLKPFFSAPFWAATVAALLLSGCATNTMTGRMQLKLVSDEAVSQQSASYYSAMVADFNKKQKLVEEGPVKARLDVITNRLIEQAVAYRPASAQWNWRVVVIDDPETVNAFCMPGGLMGIYTGFMEKLDATDDEIAQVMGHEIGHALAGHGAEKMSMQMASNIAVLALSVAIAQDRGNFGATHQALTIGALAFVNLPNSRDAESEADRIGIELAARAGYDPAAAVTLWEKMQANSGRSGSDFFRTHPSSEKRAEAMAALREPMLEIMAETAEQRADPYDWLHGDRAQRPQPSAAQAIALYSPAWGRFRAGDAELTGGNIATYLTKQGALRTYRDEARWRDLAHHVLELNYPLDVSYFYLAEAAAGLGFTAAAEQYRQRAETAAQDARWACASRRFVTCPISEAAVLAEAD